MAPHSEHGLFRNVLLHPQHSPESGGGGPSGFATDPGHLGWAARTGGSATNPITPMHEAMAPTLDQFLGLSHQELIQRFAVGIDAFDQRLGQLTSQQVDTAFLPEAGVGRWPVRVLLGHLADAELVFVHRMRRSVAEDNPLLAVFDEQAFIDSGLYGVVASEPGKPVAVPAHSPSVGGFIAVIHTLRTWTTSWLSSLSPKQWERGCLHPERGPLTVRKIAEYDTWHLLHHAWYLNRKVVKFLGERTASGQQ